MESAATVCCVTMLLMRLVPSLMRVWTLIWSICIVIGFCYILRGGVMTRVSAATLAAAIFNEAFGRAAVAAPNGNEVLAVKDYIRCPKDNGYRSYHMILLVRGFYVEIQLRTFSMDTWAALEHQLRYKKNKTELDTLIADELKRCADELASTEISMQTIRDMILGSVE